jgi:hypothetical protein
VASCFTLGTLLSAYQLKKARENPLISVDSLIREKDAFTPAIYPLPPNASAG